MKSKQNILSYLKRGHGFPILCISGFASNHYNFEWLELPGQMILAHNRGMGNSSNDLDSYDIQQLANDCMNLMDYLKYEKFHVCGISMGGMIAMELALNYPKRVSSLSLLCTTSGGSDFYPMTKTNPKKIHQLYTKSDEAIAEQVVSQTVYDLSKIDLIKNLRKSFRASSTEVLKQKHAVESYLEQARPLEKIDLPTYILTGENDRMVDPRNSKVLHEKIKNSHLSLIPESDHLFFLEKPQIVSKKITQFIQGVPL